MSLLMGILLGLVAAQAATPAPTSTLDPWASIRVMEGRRTYYEVYSRSRFQRKGAR